MRFHIFKKLILKVLREINSNSLESLYYLIYHANSKLLNILLELLLENPEPKTLVNCLVLLRLHFFSCYSAIYLIRKVRKHSGSILMQVSNSAIIL